MSKKLKVELMDWPRFPIGTLFIVWEQSRTDAELPTAEMVEQIVHEDDGLFCNADSEMGKALLMLGGSPKTLTSKEPDLGPFKSQLDVIELKPIKDRILDTFENLLEEAVPCIENLNFTFRFTGMPISLREQMVRHRIGTRVGDRLGVDIIPDEASSSWWSQTMRVLPMGEFASKGNYVMPDSIENGPTIPAEECDGIGLTDRITETSTKQLYEDLMNQIEWTYNKLVEAGIHVEDARQVIPIGATHGITWNINLKAISHIFGKRACWVAQANLWEGVMLGMIEELCSKVHPMLRKLILPPCFKKGKFSDCPVRMINMERVQGRDGMPPCPLFVYHQTQDALNAYETSIDKTGNKATWGPPIRIVSTDGDVEIEMESAKFVENWTGPEGAEQEMLQTNLNKFTDLWGRDPYTGLELHCEDRR